MVLGFGALGVSAARDYASFPKEPARATVAEAVARSGDSNWVTLTDARWACDRAVLPGGGAGDSKNYYVPATDPAGQHRILLSFDQPVLCEETAKQPVSGVLAPLQDRLRATLRDQGVRFDGPDSAPVYVLSTYAGRENSFILMFVSLLMIGLGLGVVRHFWKLRRPQPQGADALQRPLPMANDAASEADAGAAPPASAESFGDVVSAWRHHGPVLPARPYTVSTAMIRGARIKAAIALPVGLLLGALLLGWLGGEVGDYLTERRIAQTGSLAKSVKIAGQTHSKMFINNADLDIAYEDASGGQHRGKQSLWYAFGDIDQHAPLSVRYDPAAPDRFALSWALDVGVSRMAFLLLCLGLGGLFVVLPLLLAVNQLRTVRQARRAAADSDEVLLRVTQIVEQKANDVPTGNLELHYVVVDEPAEHKPRVVLRHKNARPLLWLDEEHLVSLRCRPQPGKDRGDVLLVDEDLHPFSVPDDAVAKLRMRLTTISAASRPV